ncbi:MAG: TMEM175 family protein [Pyrinomonadaceae bacterium]
MNKTRLEAFSDAVIAIIMTVMVLELKTPQGGDLESLKPLLPTFLAYVLSFIYLGIYWNNHHHMLQATRKVNGKVLWANLHLLFWLSLIPFATGWMGENHFEPLPTAVYGAVLLMAGLAYTILQNKLVHHTEGENTLLGEAVGRDLKGKLSLIFYLLAIGLAFVNQNISQVIYAVVALMWFIPDRRIEKAMNK